MRGIMYRLIMNYVTYIEKQILLSSSQWQMYYIVQLLLYYTQWYRIWGNNVIVSAEHSTPVIIILVDFHKLSILRGIFTKIWYFLDLRVKKLWVWEWSFSRRKRVYGEVTRSREKELFAGEVMCCFIGNNGTYMEKCML